MRWLLAATMAVMVLSATAEEASLNEALCNKLASSDAVALSCEVLGHSSQACSELRKSAAHCPDVESSKQTNDKLNLITPQAAQSSHQQAKPGHLGEGRGGFLQVAQSFCKMARTSSQRIKHKQRKQTRRKARKQRRSTRKKRRKARKQARKKHRSKNSNDPASLKIHDGSFTVGQGGLLLARDEKSWDLSAVGRMKNSPVWMMTAWLKLDKMYRLGDFAKIGKSYAMQEAFAGRSVGMIDMSISRTGIFGPISINVYVQGLTMLTAPFVPLLGKWFKVGFGTVKKGGKLVAQLYVNGFLMSQATVRVSPAIPMGCKHRGWPKKTARCRLQTAYLDKGLKWTLKQQRSKELTDAHYQVKKVLQVRDLRYFATEVSKTLAAVPEISMITLQSFKATHGPCNVHVGETFVLLDVVERSGMCVQITKNSQPICSPLQSVGNQKKQSCSKSVVALLNQDVGESYVKLTPSIIQQLGKFQNRKWSKMTKKKQGWAALRVGTFSKPFMYVVRLAKSVFCVEEQGKAAQPTHKRCQVMKTGSCVACKYQPGFWEIVQGVDGRGIHNSKSYMYMKARHKDICSLPCKKGTSEYQAFKSAVELL